MKVTINADKCAGIGACVYLCPEVFKMDGDGSTVADRNVPPQYAESVRKAAECCPTGAIAIEE